MIFFSLLHPVAGIRYVDIAVVVVYLLAVVIIGRLSSKGTKNHDGFFLAGRKLGRVYQIFLNFGSATDSSGAVSVSSLVYQNGISGVWLQFQTVLMNPYYWFMFVWFRRTRLVTTGEIFEDRFGDRKLGRFYAIWQIATAIALIGFGNLLGYKLITSLWVKPEATYTVTERVSVDNYRRWKVLEGENSAAALIGAPKAELQRLRDQAALGQLFSEVSPLRPLVFYCVFSGIVGLYVIAGGLSAIAVNEAVQGVLIVIFSAILLPFGIHAIGGFHALRENIPPEFFSLFGGADQSPFSIWAVAAILFVSLVQIHADIGLMGVAGSARTEYAARFGGTAGTYAKRMVIILWGLTGLLAVALYRGAHSVSDADSIWGIMSRDLLPAGLLGLMVAGVLAGKMSYLSTRSVWITALLVRNVYPRLNRSKGEGENLVVVKLSAALVLALGIAAAYLLVNVTSALKLLLVMNVPFGAAIALTFWWRRLTGPAVWTCVITFAVVLLLVPVLGVQVSAVASRPALLRTSEIPGPGGLRPPLFFDSIGPSVANDPSSAPAGKGRFNVELFALDAAGVDLTKYRASDLLTAQFLVDGITPIVVLIFVSLLTRPSAPDRIGLFYGKLKTPVGPTPEEEHEAVLATTTNPTRFDDRKLWPRSNWEFTKWDRTDTLGFLSCCAVSFLMVAGFWLVLYLVASA
ncbi:MAG: hypothetical protein ABIZ04_17910 [Opitutus sp.]